MYNYYPDGDGQYYSSVTIYLYYYDKNGDYEYIQDDEDLQGAFYNRRNRYCLQVTAAVWNSETSSAGSSSEGSTSASTSTSFPRTVSFSDDDTIITDRPHSNQSYETIDDSVRGYDTSIIKTLKKFVKQKRVSCHHRRRKKWSGVRNGHHTHWGYSLCGSCHEDLNASDKHKWVSEGLPWEPDAPAYPLSQGDRGSDVCHLQYLLTRLGHMTLSATAEATGYYQENTEKALENFRAKY